MVPQRSRFGSLLWSRPAPAEAEPHPLAGDALLPSLDLFPIPAAVIAAVDAHFMVEVANESYRLAGLGSAGSRLSPHRMPTGQLTQFFDGCDSRSDFAWQFGDEVDNRHFRIRLERFSDDRRHCLMTLLDETSAVRTEGSLKREMTTDALTGLPNRAGFSDLLEAAITPENRSQYAVLAINLDRFSRVNASMGSLAGDELLISVARRLKGALRARDVLSRTGGDEFAILLTLDDGTPDALRVSRRIRDALVQPFRLSDFEIRVDCSIGIALGSDPDADTNDMILHAQFAVKRSKASGRTEVYQLQIFDKAREQFSIETELRRAIDCDGLRLAFQPICDLATGRVVSFEALARWTTERGQDMSPDTFIPVAEESGLIVPLGRWVMQEAARTLALWDRLAGGDCGVNVAVNLSAIQLQRDRVAPMVENALAQHNVAGNRLTLELTESALVTDADRIAQTMHALKGLGATLAMDDFGTGYSNLAYLQQLPIDVLKIDRSFVTKMLNDRDKVAIVRAILSLAQALGMKTTAEGVETNELGQTLAALGCTYGQGYIYAPPLSSEAAFQFLGDFRA